MDAPLAAQATAPERLAEARLSRGALLSVLMPVYNEYAYVRSAVRRVLEAPLPEGVRRELVVVDDGSTDGSREILQELDGGSPEVRLVLHERNRGKGAALRTAIAHMRGDVAVFQDADLEYDPAEHQRLIRPILEGYADVVYGSRFAYAQERRVIYYHHMLGNLFLTHLSNLFTNLNLSDMETCYKAFRSSVLKSIPIRSNGFGIEPEITAKVAKRECVVYEIPISYRGRSYAEGKKITWKDGLKALGVVLKYWIIDDCYEERYGRQALLSMSTATDYARWVARLARPHLGKRVLELGSGVGNVSRRLAGLRRVIVSESNPERLQLLHNLFAGREDMAIARVDPTRDEDFDALCEQEIDTVVALHLLEYLEDDAALAARVHRLLPRGGRFIVQVPQYPGLYSTLDEAMSHRRRYGKLELRGMLFRAGFEVEVMRDLNWLGLLGWWVNSRLLRRRRLDRVQLKIFDTLVPLLRLTAWLPLPGLSLFVVAKRR